MAKSVLLFVFQVGADPGGVLEVNVGGSRIRVLGGGGGGGQTSSPTFFFFFFFNQVITQGNPQIFWTKYIVIII